jgi:hypothetical protein
MKNEKCKNVETGGKARGNVKAEAGKSHQF